MALVERVAENAPPHKKGDLIRQVSAVEVDHARHRLAGVACAKARYSA